MSTVFLDAVGVIAVFNRQDQWHAAATTSFADLRAEQAILVTTSAVMSEVGNAFARSGQRAEISAYQSELDESGRLIYPSLPEWRSAWQAYATYYPGGPSIVDCTSFEVMRRLGLSRVFTNDAHFRDAGFDVLF